MYKKILFVLVIKISTMKDLDKKFKKYHTYKFDFIFDMRHLILQTEFDQIFNILHQNEESLKSIIKIAPCVS